MNTLRLRFFLVSRVVTVLLAVTLHVNGEPRETNSVPQAAPSKAEPEALALLQKVNDAYDQLQTVDLAGQISVNIDVAGEVEKTNQQFTSSFEAPNKFRHETQGGFSIGATGEKVYVYNEKANSYLWLESFASKGSVRELPLVVPQILQTQNPSLLFALTTNPLQEVMLTFDEARKLPDVLLDGERFPSVELTSSKDRGRLLLAVDPNTFLVRQFTIDFKISLERSGAEEVKNASVVVNYPRIDTKVKFPSAHFAWTPPADAFDMRESAGAQRPEKTADTALKGKEAPDFTLRTLDGKEVSLDDFHGNVVVLDFWATWCPPCVKSLPKMAALNEAEQGSGLKVFAVNLEEERDKVETFLQVKGINIPVLLDEDGAIAKRYHVTSIPQTVVIGKDGKVKKVFVGVGKDTEQQLQDAIDAAQNEKSTP